MGGPGMGGLGAHFGGSPTSSPVGGRGLFSRLREPQAQDPTRGAREGLCRISPLSVSRADLVPVFSFGENDIFRQVRFPEGSLLRRLQLRFKQLAGFAPCLFVGRSLFFSRCWGLLPQPSPITVVGEPGIFSPSPGCGKTACSGKAGPAFGCTSSLTHDTQTHTFPLSFAVGKPIPVPLRPHPNPEEVDRYHALYVQALQQLFEEHKGNGGLPPSQQLFIT